MMPRRGWTGLLAVLQGMDPYAFERLCKRVLRESGFIEVEVAAHSADGGLMATAQSA